jgi:hypothetical protein
MLLRIMSLIHISYLILMELYGIPSLCLFALRNNTDRSVQKNIPRMEGYPQISQLMWQHTELAIIRKFGNLNMLNLLHMQGEIMHLEDKYYKLSQTDNESSSRAYRSRDWWSLTQLDCEGKREQWDTLCEIREKLREYSISISFLIPTLEI